MRKLELTQQYLAISGALNGSKVPRIDVHGAWIAPWLLPQVVQPGYAQRRPQDPPPADEVYAGTGATWIPSAFG